MLHLGGTLTENVKGAVTEVYEDTMTQNVMKAVEIIYDDTKIESVKKKLRKHMRKDNRHLSLVSMI